MKRYLGVGLVVILIMALVLMPGCGGGGSSTTSSSSTAAASTTGKVSFTAAAVGKGEPYKLVFLTQPGDGKAFEQISIQPSVGVVDSDGNIVTSSTLPITISITTDTANSATLAGVLQVNAINGVATYSNISVEGSGTGFVLVAKTSGLHDGFSSPFNVTE